jgi:hypothetical protein
LRLAAEHEAEVRAALESQVSSGRAELRRMLGD